MTESECLAKMVAPGTHRPGKYGSKQGFGGVIQIMVTRACDKSCFGCTQGSNLAGPTGFMSPEQFEQAVRSLGFREDYGKYAGLNDPKALGVYPGIVGIFGGNPAMSVHFPEYCKTLQKLVPFERRGLWCNHPRHYGAVMRATFNPAVSNLNVHLDQGAWDAFRRDWPESQPFGLHEDSRHSPPFVAMKDVVKMQCPQCGGKGSLSVATGWCDYCDGTGAVADDSTIWELVSNCDINQHWSALIGVFRGELRAWFCEVAGAQAMLHQHEPDYPDTGLRLRDDGLFQGAHDTYRWWELGMPWFADQVRKHCFDCGVPLRGYGELAQASDIEQIQRGEMHIPVEQTSATHAGVYRPKRKDRGVEVVTELLQLDTGRIESSIKYLQNAKM